ncbi:MAG: Oligoendopeptidase F, plasmid [Lentisphaerae bacterium ADurb.Bin242]|nr:MAG: Oligoendopeptidase F, plasmid [Lentisphaerae bacterium ADurb.Bin242]
MAELKKRSELETALTWDLTMIYPDTGDWEKEFSTLDALQENFLKFKGRLADSPETLLHAFQAEDALGVVMERLYVYAHLKADEDTADSAGRARLERISAKGAEISGNCSWFQPELLSMDEARFDSFRKDETLSFYRRTLDEIAEERPHTLSAAEERILSMASDVLSAPHKAFSLLNDADMRFPSITDADGSKTELTHGNFIKFLECPVRSVRKEAFSAMYDTYAGFKNTFSSLLDSHVKTSVLEAGLRSFPSALAASLFGDKVPAAVYENLIGSIHGNISSIHRYFELRARKLGLEKLDMYDLHTPLLPECRMEIPWEEAKKQVDESLRLLGDEYHSAIGQAFEKRWIDVPECRGKRSGAYSSGCYGTPPYILLNYADTLDSMFTLAHELGHTMHSYFSDRSQAFHYASYKIFVAEVASTTNELLLHHHLLGKTKDPKMRAYLLNHLADEFRGTVFRQTMFAEFERDIHALAEDSVPLTADLLSENYFKLNRFYHGNAVSPDDRIRYEWSRIPHFYYGFYVYKYATGFSAAAALSRKIIAGETEPYMRFLKAGDSKDVLDIMKDAGVDFIGGDPVGEALRLFDETVNQLGEALGR